MPKGQLKGAVVNVPVDVNKTYKQLPRSEEIILLKLKKKLAFKGHVFFESFRPEKVRDALLYYILMSQSTHIIFPEICVIYHI